MTRPANAWAALALAAAWLCFTVEIVLVLLLAGELSVWQMALVRILVQLAVLAPLLLRRRLAGLRTRRLRLHALRTCFSCSGMVLYYLAFTALPVAVATTLTFSQAMILVVLAALVLGERVGWARGLATLVGFAGVLVVMRPGLGGYDPAMLLALGCAAASAALMLVTRQLGQTETRLAIMGWAALLSTVLLLPPALLAWQPVRLDRLPWLAVIGAAGTVGQFLLVSAFQRGEASALAPVDYVRLIFAVAAGFFVFGEIPDLATWIGSAVILTSAVAMTRHEHRLARARATSGSER